MFLHAHNIICGADVTSVNVPHLWDMRDEAADYDDV
jgi:hypothetical protein